MGFEITYHFYPRKNDENGYDTENPQMFTKQLGKMEEIPIDKLASSVMMQLARRDIMVFDVEIFEFTKRKISFKETKGGVLIKNKKFMLDGTIEIVADIQSEEDIPPPTYLQPQQQIAQAQPMPQFNNVSDRAIRWEVYDPDPMTIPMLARKFKLTPKRKYPIYEEKTTIQKINVPGYGLTEQPGYEYVITDDLGQKIKVPSMHFLPEGKGLIGMENIKVTEQDYRMAPKLMHMEQHGDPGMPVLRR